MYLRKKGKKKKRKKKNTKKKYLCTYPPIGCLCNYLPIYLHRTDSKTGSAVGLGEQVRNLERFETWFGIRTDPDHVEVWENSTRSW
jgi:hypothetical protein